MIKNQILDWKSNIKSEAGFTLIEMAIGIVITAFISLFLLQMTQQLSKSISVIADKSIATQSVIHLSNQLKFDVAGSQDLFVHSNFPPATGSGRSCTSFNPGNMVWSAPTSNFPFVRGLFTLRIVDLAYQGKPEKEWVSSSSIWVGYEVRQKAYRFNSSERPNFELWRVTCVDKSGNPDQVNDKLSQRLLLLGPNLSPILSTNNIVSCFDDFVNNLGVIVTSNVDCRAGASDGYDVSTASRTDYYKFTIPYRGTNTLINKLNSVEFQQIRRRIDI